MTAHPLISSHLYDVEKPARRVAAILRKNAARRYIRHPALLDAISPGLSASPPRRILAVCEHKLEWGGNPFGALVIPTNIAGAQIYARWMRRFGQRHEDHALDHVAEQALIAAE